MTIGAVVLIVLSGVVAALGSFYGGRVIHRRRTEGINEVVDSLFNGVAVVNAVLLAFVVFAVYERYSNLRQAATDEAAAIVVVFRDTQTFDQPARSDAQRALRSYTEYVMSNEWTSHGSLSEAAHQRPDILNPLWAAYRSEAGVERDSNVESRLHELERTRHLRHLASERSLPAVFWPLLIGSSLVSVVVAFFLSLERTWKQAVLTAMLAMVLTGTLLLIAALNRPFTGPAPISRAPFQHALLMFESMSR